MEKFLICPLASRFDFDKIAEGFKSTLDFIFGDALPAGYGNDPFYPAELRNLILEAGAGRKLMRLTYDGIERTVEPYSLAYKRPQGRPAQEYLYVWDQTGGRSSTPGIRSLLHHKIEKLSLSEEKFEARFDMELSKAGEAAKQAYFGKAFSERAVSNYGRTKNRRNPFAPVYTIQCPYCEKQFKRNTMSLALNPHKDPNGYPCRARRGYLV